MKRKLTSILPLFLATVIVFLLFPTRGEAVQFSITNTKIDAYLQEDGHVKVEETHTYSFEGDFNGITRELIPKKGTKITHFKAFEKGKPLRIENDEHLYKIHRKGSDETITVTLNYSIHNGVDVYSDVAEFYWPFFDKRNQSTYKKLTISVHPPQKTKDVIAFGYDEAFNTEQVAKDGAVIFRMGEVPSGENGDIRVVYDSVLFPKASLTAEKTMLTEILSAKQKLLDEVAEHAAIEEKLSSIAMVVIPLFAVALLFLMISTFMRAQLKRAAVERDHGTVFSVPQETMSLAATILFTHETSQPADVMTAALLDLVRKGFVQKTPENQFIVNAQLENAKKHEQFLIELLFYEIGDNGKFHFDDLASYTKYSQNHQQFWEKQTNWLKLVREEIAEQELYERNGWARLSIGLSSLLLLPFFYYFPAYDLFGWFTITIFLFCIVVLFAILFHPKSFKGLAIDYEWRSVKRFLKDWQEDEWRKLQEDEKMRLYIYGIGIKDKNTLKNSETNWDLPIPDNERRGFSAMDMATIAYFGPIASNHFHSAHQEVERTVHSSSSSSSGGGTGGGGGGSGAF